jgi:hypothetical protein
LLVAASPPGSVTVTVTFCEPVPAGDVALRDVPVTPETDVAAVVPNLTEVDAPVWVRAVPVT